MSKMFQNVVCAALGLLIGLNVISTLCLYQLTFGENSGALIRLGSPAECPAFD